MNLYILRHGLAVERGKPGFKNDADRPLTAKGKQRLRRITKAMDAMGASFNVILASPFVRAQQTAQIVAEAFKLSKKLILSDHLTPSGSPKALIEQINELKPPPTNVLIVGHEPYLSKLVALLAAGNTGLRLELKKGGLAQLQTTRLRYGRCAEIVFLVTPRQMRLIA